MVNPGVIMKRIEQIEKHLERMRTFTPLSYEAFLDNSVAQDVVEYNLFQMVNHLIDIFQHTVVDEEYGFPETAYEAAEILFKKEILTPEDVKIFKQWLVSGTWSAMTISTLIKKSFTKFSPMAKKTSVPSLPELFQNSCEN